VTKRQRSECLIAHSLAEGLDPNICGQRHAQSLHFGQKCRDEFREQVNQGQAVRSDKTLLCLEPFDLPIG